MGDWKVPAEGQCRCGQVRFRVTKPPLLTMACHCSGCQRMTAGPYSLSAAIPADGFEVTQGEPVIGGLHGAARHYFCPHCMSWLYTRPEGVDWFVNVRSTMLNDQDFSAPFIETWTSEGLPWVKTTATHSYGKLPPPDAYEGLLKEFAER